jgi:hypothetical protein
MGNDVEGNLRSLINSTVSAITVRIEESHENFRTIDVLAEIEIGFLPDTKKNHYALGQLPAHLYIVTCI